MTYFERLGQNWTIFWLVFWKNFSARKIDSEIFRPLKDKLAMLAIPMIPLQILLPWIISKYTSGPKPMNVYLYAFPCRLLIGLVLAGLVYITPNFKLEDESFPVYYYGLVLFIYALHQVRFILIYNIYFKPYSYLINCLFFSYDKSANEFLQAK